VLPNCTPVYTTPALITLFWSKVRKLPGRNACWEWTGQLSDGYGHLTIPVESGFRNIAAHRLSWIIAYGPIDPGKIIRHKVCDNKACIRPTHLRDGTHKDNVNDKVAKHRQGVRLNCFKVRYARQLRTAGVSITKIAKRIGVTPAAARRAITGETWRTV
jgi:hypothetical protein